jgi:hypothetical protein
MDKLVRRVTVIHGTRDDPKSVAVYREPRRERNRVRVTLLTRPLERGVRHLEKAIVIFGQEASPTRGIQSPSSRWLALGSSGKFRGIQPQGANEASKAVPFVNLPKL